MSVFKGYPEINFVEGQADGLHRIETNTGKVIIAGHFDNPELGQRLVDCWNAVRKIFAPAAHIEATDDYTGRLEQLRKEAVARIEQLESGSPPVAGLEWRDMSTAPLGKEVIETTVAPLETLLAERKSTHGEYRDHANYTQAIKAIIHSSPNWDDMESHQRETLEMVAHKIGRILAGDHRFDDHWKDISGYAKLTADRLVGAA